jgi:hypothetical protein
MNFRSKSDVYLPVLIALATFAMDAKAVKKSSSTMLPVELSDIGYVEIKKKNVKISVSDADVQFEVGERMPLIQKNQRYYIALVTYDNGSIDLVAVPRTLDNGQGSAWITKEGELIFGSKTDSAFGRFYLRPGEILPIVFEDDETFMVLCERNSNVFSMEIPKSTKGVSFVGELSASVVQKMRQRDVADKKMVMAKSGGRSARQWDISNTVSSDRSIQYSQTVLSDAEFASGGSSGSQGSRSPALSNTRNQSSTPSGSKIRVAASGSPNTVPDAQASQQTGRNTAKTTSTSKTIRLPTSSGTRSGSISSHPTLPQANSARKVVTSPAAQVPQIAQVTPDTVEVSDVQNRMRIETTLDLDPEPSNDAEPTAEDRKLIQETNDLLGLTTAGDNETVEEKGDLSVTKAAVKVFAFFGGIAVVFLLLVIVIAKALNRRPKAKRVSKKKAAEAPPLPVAQEPPQAAEPPAPAQASTPPALAPASEPPAAPEPDTTGFTEDLDFPTQESFDPEDPYTTDNLDETPYEEITIIPESTGLSISELAEGSGVPDAFDPDAASLTEEPADSQSEISDAFSSTKGGTFTGSLCGFNISELIQFLNSSRESGTLSVTDDANHTQSKVYFENGEIVNAEHAEVTGEEAVADILRFDDGFFVFKRQEYLPVERAITISTMSLLMNVSQSIDEGMSLNDTLGSTDMLSSAFDTTGMDEITSEETPYFRKAP